MAGSDGEGAQGMEWLPAASWAGLVMQQPRPSALHAQLLPEAQQAAPGRRRVHVRQPGGHRRERLALRGELHLAPLLAAEALDAIRELDQVGRGAPDQRRRRRARPGGSAGRRVFLAAVLPVGTAVPVVRIRTARLEVGVAWPYDFVSVSVVVVLASMIVATPLVGVGVLGASLAVVGGVVVLARMPGAVVMMVAVPMVSVVGCGVLRAQPRARRLHSDGANKLRISDSFRFKHAVVASSNACMSGCALAPTGCSRPFENRATTRGLNSSRVRG